MLVKILLFISMSSWVIGAVLYYRNNEVAKFRRILVDKCYDYSLRHYHEEPFESAFRWFYDKLPSYPKMLFSLKKLSLEQWASPELIAKLES